MNRSIFFFHVDINIKPCNSLGTIPFSYFNILIIINYNNLRPYNKFNNCMNISNDLAFGYFLELLIDVRTTTIPNLSDLVLSHYTI